MYETIVQHQTKQPTDHQLSFLVFGSITFGFVFASLHFFAFAVSCFFNHV